MTKRKSKGAYMISAVAEMYEIHPQTLRLYEREGLLKPSRTEGNTRLYTDEDLQRLEFILSLARDLGVNISGIAIILQMRERMEEMQRQIQEFVQYIQHEVLARASAAADPSKGAIVPLRRPLAPAVAPQKLSGADGRGRPSLHWPGSNRLLFSLETITAASVFCHLLRYFQKRSACVRQRRFLAVDQAQLALKMQIAHRNAYQLSAGELGFHADFGH
jgi:MerR family transcriptional regulator/heat shock protein HspR